MWEIFIYLGYSEDGFDEVRQSLEIYFDTEDEAWDYCEEEGWRTDDGYEMNFRMKEAV